MVPVPVLLSCRHANGFRVPMPMPSLRGTEEESLLMGLGQITPRHDSWAG